MPALLVWGGLSSLPPSCRGGPPRPPLMIQFHRAGAGACPYGMRTEMFWQAGKPAPHRRPYISVQCASAMSLASSNVPARKNAARNL